jgi:tRNA pseudouridine55 synthase
LPICLGEASKTAAFMLEAGKRYRATARFGEATSTGDIEGEHIQTCPIPLIDPESLAKTLGQFTGKIEQVPPMYSALKHEGKPLYEYARAGIEIDRPARAVTIHQLELVEWLSPLLSFDVHCSKGTYIRTLIEDIALAAGTVAHTASLHRETVGSFREEDMLDLGNAEKLAENEPELLKQRLLAPDEALGAMPAVSIEAEREGPFVRGQAVTVKADAPGGEVRVYGAEEQFLGVGELGSDGTLAPRRIFNISK